MRKIDIGLGAFVSFLGLFVFVQARALSFYDEAVPGPGFMPTILSVALALSGLALIATRAVGARAKFGKAKLPTPALAVKVLSVAGAILAGGLLLTPIGFVPAMMVMVAVLLLGIERLRNLQVLAVILVLPVAVYLLFAVLLGVPLPAGPLGV